MGDRKGLCFNKIFDGSTGTAPTMASSDTETSHNASFDLDPVYGQGDTATIVEGEDEHYENFLLFLKSRGQEEDVCSLSPKREKDEHPSTSIQCASEPSSTNNINNVLSNPLYFSTMLLMM